MRHDRAILVLANPLHIVKARDRPIAAGPVRRLQDTAALCMGDAVDPDFAKLEAWAVEIGTLMGLFGQGRHNLLCQADVIRWLLARCRLHTSSI